MAATVWKGHLTFGLVSIPVRLFAAARSERISLHQLHSVCHTRIRQPLFCPTCNRIVERSEIIKGYEYEKDQYVLFDPEELDKIEPASASTMEILECVKLAEVDPIYFDASYYMAPEEPGKKAYRLLFRAMEESGYGAIAKLCMHQREYIVVIRPHENGLMLHTMYYADEIRHVSEYGETDKAEPREQEKKLALQLVESLAAPFEPAKYHDGYQQSLRAMIEAKRKGQEVAEAPHPRKAQVIDLMEALQKSLSGKSAAAETQKAPAGAAPRAAQSQKKSRKKSAG
jgi:DNA end-binding protein Ku